MRDEEMIRQIRQGRTELLDLLIDRYYQDIFRFFQIMIRFRKDHRILRTNLSNGACGFPDVSFHGVNPWQEQFTDFDRYIGVMFAGQEPYSRPQVIYVASNAYWESLDITLPELPGTMVWKLAVDTWNTELSPCRTSRDRFCIQPRSVMVWIGE